MVLEDNPIIDIGILLPEWEDVKDASPVQLAGVVVPGEEDYPFPLAALTICR